MLDTPSPTEYFLFWRFSHRCNSLCLSHPSIYIENFSWPQTVKTRLKFTGAGILSLIWNKVFASARLLSVLFGFYIFNGKACRSTLKNITIVCHSSYLEEEIVCLMQCFVHFKKMCAYYLCSLILLLCSCVFTSDMKVMEVSTKLSRFWPENKSQCIASKGLKTAVFLPLGITS